MTLVFYIIIDLCAIMLMRAASKYAPCAGYPCHPRMHFSRSIARYKLFAFLSLMVLFLVAALRDHVGRDYTGYLNAFIRVNNGTLTQADENWLSPAYRLLCLIVGLFGKENYILMFAVTSAITLFFLYKAICLNSPDWTLSLFLFIAFCLYYQTFNQMRQMLALGITTYAITYLRKGEWIKYILWTLAASMFHTSAIVMLALVVVSKWKISAKTLFVYALGTVLVFLFFNPLLHLLSYTNYGRTYLGWAKYNTSYEISSFLNLGVRIIMLVGCMFFKKKVLERSPSSSLLYHSAIICTIFQLITLRSYLFGRVTTYFFAAYIFLIPEVVCVCKRMFKQRDRKWVTFAVYAVFTAYHFVYYFSGSGAIGSGYDAYKSLLL